MQFPTFIVFAFSGLILFCVGGLARGYLRNQLQVRGITLAHWVTIVDEMHIYVVYAKEALKGHVPWWPIALTVIGIFGGMVTSFMAIIAHNKHW
jgi:hypothetical protein